MGKIFGRCVVMIRNWKVLVKTEAGDLERGAAELECRSARPHPPKSHGSPCSKTYEMKILMKGHLLHLSVVLCLLV
jgi:hypothetical protein